MTTTAKTLSITEATKRLATVRAELAKFGTAHETTTRKTATLRTTVNDPAADVVAKLIARRELPSAELAELKSEEAWIEAMRRAEKAREEEKDAIVMESFATRKAIVLDIVRAYDALVELMERFAGVQQAMHEATNRSGIELQNVREQREAFKASARAEGLLDEPKIVTH